MLYPWIKTTILYVISMDKNNIIWCIQLMETTNPWAHNKKVGVIRIKVIYFLSNFFLLISMGLHSIHIVKNVQRWWSLPAIRLETRPVTIVQNNITSLYPLEGNQRVNSIQNFRQSVLCNSLEILLELLHMCVLCMCRRQKENKTGTTNYPRPILASSGLSWPFCALDSDSSSSASISISSLHLCPADVDAERAPRGGSTKSTRSWILTRLLMNSLR